MAADVSGATETAKSYIPKIKLFGDRALDMVAWLIIIIIVCIIIGIAVYFIVRRIKFDKKIVIFEEINGIPEPTKQDRAMELKMSTAGDTIFYTQKYKKYLPNPTIQTGRKTYWYFIRSDGEWINIGPGNWNQDFQKVGARFLDKEMRYARTQIQKGLKDRYENPGFWKQYGALVMSMGFIALIAVMTFLLFDKWVDLANTTNAAVEQGANVMDRIDSLLGKMDNICSGGSGLQGT